LEGENDMPKTRLGLPTQVAIYGGLALAIGLGISQAVVAAGLIAAPPEPGQTSLDHRVSNTREIKKALRTPLPAVEPLPPISSKLARRNDVNDVNTAKVGALSPEARAAMAEAPRHTVWAAWCSTNPLSCQRVTANSADLASERR
jgi:hypothetical protein